MNRNTWTKRLVLLVTLMGLGLMMSGCSMLGRKQTYNDYRPPSGYDNQGHYEGGQRW